MKTPPIKAFEFDSETSTLIVSFEVETSATALGFINSLSLPMLTSAAPETPSPKPAAAKPASTAPKAAPAQAAPKAPDPLPVVPAGALARQQEANATRKPSPAEVAAVTAANPTMPPATIVETERGKVTIAKRGDKYVAEDVSGLVSAEGPDEDSALGALLELLDEPKDEQKVTPAKPVIPDAFKTGVAKVQAAKAASASSAPADLVAATSFRQVMTWMLGQGIKTKEEITAKCEELREQVPAIARLSGDLAERVGRALEVIQMG